MKRQYTFPDTPDGAVDATIAWIAMSKRVNERSGERGESKKSIDDQRSEGKIIRAIKLITDPVGPDPERGYPDLRERILKKGGGILELDQTEYKRLQDYIGNMQWGGSVTDVAFDLLDRLEANGKKVEDAPKPALPAAEDK